MDDDFALEIDAFATPGADYARTLITGQILRGNLDFHPLFIEEDVV